mmetsp:Transcript_38471/g.96806  ORF Transcript_38471/g.96806 Transcript_38471/m.96806 type:complete len:201 (+) Transcript_38471:929-1531(+)
MMLATAHMHHSALDALHHDRNVLRVGALVAQGTRAAHVQNTFRVHEGTGVGVTVHRDQRQTVKSLYCARHQLVGHRLTVSHGGRFRAPGVHATVTSERHPVTERQAHTGHHRLLQVTHRVRQARPMRTVSGGGAVKEDTMRFLAIVQVAGGQHTALVLTPGVEHAIAGERRKAIVGGHHLRDGHGRRAQRPRPGDQALGG